MFLFLSIIFISSIIMLVVDIFVAGLPIWIICLCIYGGIAAEIALDGIIAILFEFLVPHINVKAKIFTIAKNEIKFYKFIGIKKIKGKLPDLGKINKFAKNKIESPSDPKYLELYMQHGIAGEIEHAVSVVLGFVIIFVFPLNWIFYFGLPIAIVNAILNTLPILALRYNRSRLIPIYERRLKNQIKQETNGETGFTESSGSN